MSSINEWMEGHQGQINALGRLAAINQGNRLIEKQRLDLEQQRHAAEDGDQEMGRQQAEHIRDRTYT